MSERNVGILVNDWLFRGIPKGRTHEEQIPFYEEAAIEYGLTPIYFRLEDISLRKAQVKALVCENGSYQLRTFPLPKVIHNRAMIHRNKEAKRIIDKLCSDSSVVVFNRYTRYGKWRIHQLLMKNEQLRPHMPETKLATLSSIRALAEKYEAVIVKPDSSSIGRGIMKLDKTSGRFRLIYPARQPRNGRTRWKTVRFKTRLPGILRSRVNKSHFIVQQRLNLATYDGRPFDMRVSIQRGEEGIWQMTGIAVKVAKMNAFITNVAQGGSVYTLGDVLKQHPQLDPITVSLSIQRFALMAAEHLSHYLPSLSDIGFDIGITPDGYPVFIEMNLRDQRYAFREGGMLEEWKRTYANPMIYARYLLEQ